MLDDSGFGYGDGRGRSFPSRDWPGLDASPLAAVAALNEDSFRKRQMRRSTSGQLLVLDTEEVIDSFGIPTRVTRAALSAGPPAPPAASEGSGLPSALRPSHRQAVAPQPGPRPRRHSRRG